MKATLERENGSDGRKLARQLYGGPPQAKAGGDGAKPPEYEDLFGTPALSGEAASDVDETDRVPFDPQVSFHDLRRRCIAAGEHYGEPYERLLSSLRGVEPLARHASEESRGASYKRLCAAAHMAGFSKRERKNLYWIAEKVGMSDRFAGHIIASLKRNRGGQR